MLPFAPPFISLCLCAHNLKLRRVCHAVSGGWLPPARRGIKLSGLATLWDFYATFGTIGGLSASDATSDAAAAAAGLPPVDSISMWGYWSGASERSPRQEVPMGTALGSSEGAGNEFLVTGVEALVRADGMKLIVTAVGDVMSKAIWTGPSFPNRSCLQATGCSESEWEASVDCSRGCLYNLTQDPSEHYDLSEQLPLIVTQMRQRIEQLNRTTFSPHRGEPNVVGCDVALQFYSGFWVSILLASLCP